MSITLYNHLHTIILVLPFTLNKPLCVLDNGSPFMGSAIYLPKPRKHIQQYNLIT